MRESGSNNSTVRSSKTFKKFRDNAKRRLDLRKNRYSFTPAKTAGQLLRKKLLRSIKKRQYQTPNSKRLSNQAKSSRMLNESIEEGEIISDDECDITQCRPAPKSSFTIIAKALDAEDNDDDCICIEPQIEQIVIDDDATIKSTSASTSRSKNKNNSSSGYVSLIERMKERLPQSSAPLVTSTPVHTAAATTNTAETNANGAPLFFEDVSSANWSIYNFSAVKEIDYSSLRCLSGGRCRKKDNYAHKGGKRHGKQKGKKKHKTKKGKVDTIILDDNNSNDATLKAVKDEQVGQVKVELQQTDDSVIFISETVGRSDKPAKMGDFVPLDSNNVPNPIYLPQTPPRQPRKAAIKSGLLFTNSEKKELRAYNDNAYNPNADDSQAPETRSKKRLILIDACNVAFNHSLSKEFSVKGLKICIDYFEKMGHEVKAVLPQFRMHRCSDSATMFELHEAGKIVLTPCKNLPGKFSSSYDDRFILQLAAEMDAAIVSNDNYRDLINENAAFKKLIENRVLGFTWCNDLFMVAKDPYGRWGPPLQVILNRI